MTRGGRAQVVHWSLIGHKASQVSRRSVASVSRQSGRGCGSGARVYADRLTNGMRGSQARKSVVVRSQVTLITWSIMHFLLTRMSVAPRHQWYCWPYCVTWHQICHCVILVYVLAIIVFIDVGILSQTGFRAPSAVIINGTFFNVKCNWNILVMSGFISVRNFVRSFVLVHIMSSHKTPLRINIIGAMPSIPLYGNVFALIRNHV